MDLFGFAWCCFAVFFLVLIDFGWFSLVWVGFACCLALLCFARFCLDLLGFACCLVVLGVAWLALAVKDLVIVAIR